MSLQITRLRIEQLRRFRQPLELGGFEPGLNILSGPNEAGKSTLVRAIRAAFFERHRSTSVEDLRPWGEGSTAAPQIELDFMLDGQPHRLVKSFLGRKRCTLQSGTRVLDSTDAEDEYALIPAPPAYVVGVPRVAPPRADRNERNTALRMRRRWLHE